MKSIVYVGMDVHKESYSVCSYRFEDDAVKHYQKLKADYRQVLMYIESLRAKYGEETEFICGYEAGPLGYRLYHELKHSNIDCIILAPTSMAVTNTNRVKTDRRDAGNIARCLALRTYSAVHVPTKEDEAIKEYIRMRDDKKQALKKVKQQILAFVLRHGFRYEDGKSYWTQKHTSWLKSLDLGGLLQETLDEYLVTFEYLSSKIFRLDAKIEELSQGEAYAEKVSKLKCLLGVKTYTALSVIVETSDFTRFDKADKFASFLGLVPSEDSSGQTKRRGGITKAGNSHVRRLLVEASQSYTRGKVGFKSKELSARQFGNSPQDIAYADKANERLRRKFYRLTANNTNRNTAVTAVARELACFMWGLMTGNTA